jgi:hypothetical protein
MRKLFWHVVVCSILLPGRVLGACHVVTPSGSGTKSGSDWNSSCAGFTGSCAASSLTRGDTYYVAAGSYGQVSFSTPDSGTSIITIKAPTSGDHCTDSGWNAGTMLGSAIFKSSGNTPAIYILNDYMTIDGQYGAGGTVAGGDITPSDYGIQAIWGSGAITTAILRVGYNANPFTGITVRHVAVVGPNGAPGYDGTTCEPGTEVRGGASNPSYLFEYNLFTKSGDFISLNGVHNATVQYNIGYLTYSIGGCHGDPLEFSNGADNITLRYNQWRGGTGTAVYNMPCGTCSTSANIYIYGERIYWVDTDQCRIPDGSLGACGIGDAILWGSGGTGVTGNFYFINNTIDNMSATHFGGTNWAMPYNSSGTTWGTVLVQDNIISNSVAMATPGCGTGNTCTSYSWDHQAYYNTTNTADTDANKQTLSSDPFIGAAGQDFRLKNSTNAGVTFSSPYNTDPDGNTRGADGTWDRGAYEFNGNGGKPDPPQSLLVTGVQ